jgi:hypothetical protein
VTSTGTFTTSGAFSLNLAPGTLYFLAVGCSGTVTLEGVVAGGGASVPLTGAAGFTTTSTQITSTWTFTAGDLPPTFANGGSITSTAGPVPNVYAGP